MIKILKQLIRYWIKQVITKNHAETSFGEFLALSGQGNSKGWKFNRDELHKKV